MGMTIFDSKDPAMRAGGELGLTAAYLVSSFAEAAAAGRQAADARREERAAYKYACELNAARGRADELGRVAIRAVRHVASLEAEVRRLRTALAQRQAHIDLCVGRKRRHERENGSQRRRVGRTLRRPPA